MATDTNDDLADRLRLRGLRPRKIGENSWECKCPGRSPVAHSLLFGNGTNGKFYFECQRPENCTLPGNLEILKQRYLEQHMQSQRIVERRPAESQGPLSQDPELAMADSGALAAATVADSSAVPGGTFQESPAGEVAATAPIDDPALGDDSDGLTPAPSGDTEKTRATDQLLRIAAAARPFRRPDGRYSVSIAVDGHQECHDLESPDVVRWLTRRFFESAGRLPSASALAATIRTLAAQADMAGATDSDFVRVGSNGSGSSLFLDLGDSSCARSRSRPAGGKSSKSPTSISGERPDSALFRFRPATVRSAS